ncbi:hypothetical protein [Phytohabitans houttuyneae]|uniref:DUF4145 domain-containing protein n=1 Tax=Phytohabitans houttuyneae TaxID=1076126 RepID=A0A6V8K260_9ACTN|nr:hypothetical protein [Phytohabitans houttuyneae]GFJ76451.1 hypothetical protein Phou_006310 [Phytohabitans houttuyneae]
MGALEFISKLVDALSWPLAIIVLLFLFRAAIRNLLEQFANRVKDMTAFRGPVGIEADFDARVLEVREEARTISTSDTTQGPTDSDRFEYAGYDLSGIEDYDVENLAIQAEQMPRSAVIESWIYLEDAIEGAADRLGLLGRGTDQSPTSRRRLMTSKLLEYLASAKPDKIREIEPVVQELRALRNEVAHNRRKNLSPLAAYDYAVTAIRLAQIFKNL